MNKTKIWVDIIKATLKDIDKLVPLYFKLNKHHYQNIDDFYKEYTNSKIKKLIKRAIAEKERDIYIVIDKEDNIKGLIEIEFKAIEDDIELMDKNYIEIKSIIVDENYRGENIGSELMQYIEKIGQEKKIDHIELKVYNFNEAAIKFYVKKGYKPFAHYYKKDISKV